MLGTLVAAVCMPLTTVAAAAVAAGHSSPRLLNELQRTAVYHLLRLSPGELRHYVRVLVLVMVQASLAAIPPVQVPCHSLEVPSQGECDGHSVLQLLLRLWQGAPCPPHHLRTCEGR